MAYLVGKWDQISMVMNEEPNFEQNVANEYCKDSDADGRLTAAGPPPAAASAV